MNVFVRAAIAAAVIAALGWFAYAHAPQRVALNFGLFRFDSVSLPVVVFASVAFGMAIMIAVGVRNDVRTRRLLRRYQAVAELGDALRPAAETKMEDGGRGGQGARRSASGTAGF